MLTVYLVGCLQANEMLKDVNSADKSLMEKVALIELLDKKEKATFHAVLDAFISKKKLKDALSEALQGAE